MANEFAGKAKFTLLDFDKSKFAEEYKVLSLPHTFIVKDGEIAESISGKGAAERIHKAVETAL